MSIEILEMTMDDYEDAVALWKRCPGVGLSDADSSCAINRFLEKNPGLCFAAKQDGTLVGTVLCGSDGRRGYLYHLAVDPGIRRMGLGQKLVQKALDALKEQNIQKCHLMIFATNDAARYFYEVTGWKLRKDIEVFSFDVVKPESNSPC